MSLITLLQSIPVENTDPVLAFFYSSRVAWFFYGVVATMVIHTWSKPLEY